MNLTYNLINLKYTDSGGSSKNALDPFIFSPNDIDTLEFIGFDYLNREYVPVTMEKNGQSVPFILHVGQDDYYDGVLNGEDIPQFNVVPSQVYKITLKDGRVIELILNEDFNYWQCKGKKIICRNNNIFEIVDTNGIKHSFDIETEKLGKCFKNKIIFILKDGTIVIDGKYMGFATKNCMQS